MTRLDGSAGNWLDGQDSFDGMEIGWMDRLASIFLDCLIHIFEWV